MDVEGSSRLSKFTYKIVLYLTKVLPIIIAGLYLLNTILSYFYIDIPAFSYIVFWLMLLLIYALSYALKFCAWHRMFLHYIAFNTIICSIDYSYGIPIDNWELFMGNLIFSGIFMFIILYLKFRK